MEFKEDHCECISLPENFNLIASSENCEVEMMEHQTKKIIGVQFHPEVSGNNGEWFFDQFLKMCKAK
jgi:GMP synthase-like glutamine amidotransferase